MRQEAPSIEDDLQRRAERLFLEAVDLPADERRDYLARHCGDEPALADSVRRLFDARGRMGSFLERLPQGLDDPTPPDDDNDPPHPTRIGSYEIIRVVGSGGMGIVYEARQDRPHRRVALKVIHPTLVSSQWLQRFQREAEVLGRLHHPGIATIHEAGEAEVLVPGRLGALQPFMAMEYVDGTTLRDYAVHRKLDTRRRLKLVARVCGAMQHAHEHGIVHRDLKPSNILIDSEGQPKVIDFGIAHATGPDWVTMPIATRTGQLVGTIPYMSPEQIGGKSSDVDARADVYALGVIAYELLSGRLPIETRDRSLPETMRAIREDEPSGLGSLDSGFRGDIDAIVGKALRKEPERRYATAGDLGDDILRYLRGEPIRARPTSTVYQLRRFARRNKVLAGGVAATIVALALGLVVAAGFARREARQRHIAESMSAQAERAAHEARFTAAIASLDSLNPSAAARSLDAVPERLRAWEWRHLMWRAGQHLAEIPPPDAGLMSLSLAQRASLLFTADGKGVVRAWSLDTGALVREFPTEPFYWRGPMAASPDGNLLLGDSAYQGLRNPDSVDGRQLIAWDAHSGQELWRRQGAFSLGRDLRRRPGAHILGDDAYDATGALVAVGPWGQRSILLLDPRTGEDRETIPIPDGTALHPHFSPDGSRLVYHTATDSGIVDRPTLSTNRLGLGSAGFVDGGKSAIAHHGRDVLLVNLDTGARTVVPGVRTVDWPVGLSLLAVGEPAFESPTRRFLTPGENSIVVRRLRDGKVTGHLGSRSDPLGWSSDGKRVATIDEDAVVRIWDAATDSRLSRIPAPPRLRNDVFAMAPDGKSYATASWGFVKLYELGSGVEKWNAYTLEPFIYALAFSPDGLRLAAGGLEGSVTILDAGTGAVACTLPMPLGTVTGLAWLPTGDSLLVVTSEGALRWIDALTGAAMGDLALPRERFPCHSDDRAGPSFQCIDVSVDGTRFAVAGEFPPEADAAGADEAVAGVAVWDTASARRLGVFRVATGAIGGVALDTAGRTLAAVVNRKRYSSGSPDELAVWDVATGERILSRIYEAVGMRAVAFSPERDRVVLGGDDGNLRFTDVRGELQDVLIDTGRPEVLWLSIASDGSRIVAGTPDELVHLETGPPPGGFDARARVTEARARVDEVYRELFFADDVTRRLHEDSELPEEIRLAALDLVRVRGDHMGWLNSDATLGYRATSLSKEELRRVLRKIELANRLRPDHPEYVATLGKCQFRAERYREALMNLDRAAELYRSSGRVVPVEDLAFAAMARWRLGEQKAAERSMRNVELLLVDGGIEPGSSTLASIAEARALIGMGTMESPD